LHKSPSSMSTMKYILLITLASLQLLGAESYSYDPKSKNFDWNPSDLEVSKLSSLAAELKLDDTEMGKAIQNNKLKMQHFLSSLESYITKYPSSSLSMQQPRGRMALPSTFTNPSAFTRLMEEGFLLEDLKPSNDQISAMFCFYFKWKMQCKVDADSAFNEMLNSNENKAPDQYDMMRFKLQEHYGDSTVTVKITKPTWQRMHQSKNSIYRLMALDKFSSFEQSPAELLALYKECLFGACSYLEIRALEAILAKKDFRPEVEELLKNYLASGPLDNDGTVPNTRVQFQSPVEGAKMALKLIKENPSPTADLPIDKRSEQKLPAISDAKRANVAPKSAAQEDTFPWILITLSLAGLGVFIIWIVSRRNNVTS
ncbi:MAG: hypothetical protein NTV80_25690, partial [Verrucomicrobia bacterium]|nr:hypothetical protein [Verrucomicrobiota bacterium]